jgi:hypothetical protein
MTIFKAISLGTAGNEVSKVVTGTSEVSAGRSAVATGAGAALGGAAAGVLVVSGFVAAAPLTVPLAVASGVVGFVASRFR